MSMFCSPKLSRLSTADPDIQTRLEDSLQTNIKLQTDLNNAKKDIKMLKNRIKVLEVCDIRTKKK